MNVTSARTELASILTGALPASVAVVDHLPDAIAPPVVLVAWADPWLKLSTLCAYEAQMEVVCLAQRIEPGGQYERLEAMVSAILPAIKKADYFTLVDVTSPYPMQVGGVDYLAASVNVSYDMED